eukprot:s7836_g2.t1
MASAVLTWSSWISAGQLSTTICGTWMLRRRNFHWSATVHVDRNQWIKSSQEEINILADNAVVVADNVLKPGAPYHVWRISTLPHYATDIIDLREFGSAPVEEWGKALPTSFHG